MTVSPMSSPRTGALRMTWVEVRDERGRTHLEARWGTAPAAPPAPAVRPAAAA